jgi:ribosomal protein S18 acetylase RimI-like enzyme
MSFTIRTTTADDWHEVRALRLEMLGDTPMGFAETLETALQVDEENWRLRGARGTNPQSTALVAVTADGRWVGTMGGFLDNSVPLLVGVYVTPEFRGSAGVADALLARVEKWARDYDDALLLHVHADNTRARRYYEKHGYTETGVTLPYVLDASQTELEMSKRLR